MWLVLISGIFLRIILSAASYHPDTPTFDLAGRIMGEGHVLDFYDYLYSLPPEHQISQTYPPYLFNYPPAIYFLHFIFVSLFNPLFDQEFLNNFIFSFTNVLGDWRLNLHLIFLKLPYMIFDISISFLLLKFFSSGREKRFVFGLWIFNPVSLYATYMMGQFDIIPTFFVVLSLGLLTQKETIRLQTLVLSAVLLGFGASFKIYPLLLAIPLASLTRSWAGRLGVISAAVLPYVLTAAPYINSHGYRANALVANQTLKSFYAQLQVSGGESIILFLGVLVFVYAYFLHAKSMLPLWRMYFITLLVFFIFTHYHPQWFLWLTPFLILELTATKFKHWLLMVVLILGFFGSLFFFDPLMNIGILSPVWNNLYFMPSIWDTFSIQIDYNFARSILHTIFVGIACYLIYDSRKYIHD